jgi:hypothetical protein
MFYVSLKRSRIFACNMIYPARPPATGSIVTWSATLSVSRRYLENPVIHLMKLILR